jgi:hypothetical protein
LRFEGNPSSGNIIVMTGEVSHRFRLYGADIDRRIRMDDSQETEIGWCIFGRGRGLGAKFAGGPGWITNVGRNSPPGTRTSIHDNEAYLYYRHGVDANGDNGDDFMQNTGELDFYNNRIISTLTTGFAGANHQDGIQTDGHNMRIYNNYFENLSNYCIFGEFWGTGGTTGWQIYNNVFNYSDPVLRSQPSAAITFDHGVVTYSNYKIVNNTFLGGNQALYWTGTNIQRHLRSEEQSDDGWHWRIEHLQWQ